MNLSAHKKLRTTNEDLPFPLDTLRTLEHVYCLGRETRNLKTHSYSQSHPTQPFQRPQRPSLDHITGASNALPTVWVQQLLGDQRPGWVRAPGPLQQELAEGRVVYSNCSPSRALDVMKGQEVTTDTGFSLTVWDRPSLKAMMQGELTAVWEDAKEG